VTSREFFTIPRGYRVERTDERVPAEPMRYFTRASAIRHATKYPPALPSYHHRVERWGLFDWRAVPYQNRLCPVDAE
jgi:hypothetical protein